MQSISPDEVAEAAKEIYMKLTGGQEPPPEVLEQVKAAYREALTVLPKYLEQAYKEVTAAYAVAA
jgi:hypothetical protein